MKRQSYEPKEVPTRGVKIPTVLGHLPVEDLDLIRGILTLEQDDLDRDEMAEVIAMVDGVTVEAASILVSDWYDGGKNKKEWEEKELNHWIMNVLATKIASRIATRPIRLDSREAERSIDRLVNFLSTGYWGRHPDEPIKDQLVFKDNITVKAVDGSEFEVLVQYKTEYSKDIDMVLGGGSGKTTTTKKPAILIMLNGFYSASAFTTTTSGERFKDRLTEVLEHEMTHQADVYAKKFDPEAKRHSIPTKRN